MSAGFYFDPVARYTEADIERAARIIAKVYVLGFRSGYRLVLPATSWVLSPEEWVEANWESFCVEACEALAPATNKITFIQP